MAPEPAIATFGGIAVARIIVGLWRRSSEQRGRIFLRACFWAGRSIRWL
jgi:hypothetical protein